MPWALDFYANGNQIQRVIKSTWMRSGYAVTKEKVRHLVEEQSKYFGDCTALGPTLSYRYPLVYDETNNKRTDRFNLNHWFNTFEHTVKKYNVRPCDVYNVSSMNLRFMDPGEKGVDAAKRASRRTWQAQVDALATVVSCVCADGSAPIRPFYILYGASPLTKTWMNATFRNLEPPHANRHNRIAYSERVGWTSGSLGTDLMLRLLATTTAKADNASRHRLILVNSNLGHFHSKLVEFATNEKCLFLYTPPWSRHIPIQPVDRLFSQQPVTQLTTPVFGQTFLEASEDYPFPLPLYSQLMGIGTSSETAVRDAWEVCGLHPFDPSKLDYLVATE